MASVPIMTSSEVDGGMFRNPWPALITAIAAAALAAFSTTLPETWEWIFPARLVLVFGAVLLAGAGVAIQPRSAWALGGASAVAAMSSMAMGPLAGSYIWDSACVLLRILAVVAAVSAVLVLCPQWVRRLAVSLLILFHFAGIMTAVTSTHPQPWLSGQLWHFVFRPYLQYLYLNNAYHFYSPEPGPASFLAFFVEYESDVDGQRFYQWVKEPHLDKRGNPVPWRPRVQYTRRLSLAENTNQPQPFLHPLYLDYKGNLRREAARYLGIPLHPELAMAAQYREPNKFSKHWISTYARHVARNHKHAERPDLPVKSIKVYRIEHRIVNAGELAAEPEIMYDKTTYLPFYQGEFDPDGRLISAFGSGPDPLLYWVIPIARFPKQRPEQTGAFQRPMWSMQEDYEVIDYLKIHAGDVDPTDKP